MLSMDYMHVSTTSRRSRIARRDASKVRTGRFCGTSGALRRDNSMVQKAAVQRYMADASMVHMGTSGVLVRYRVYHRTVPAVPTYRAKFSMT